MTRLIRKNSKTRIHTALPDAGHAAPAVVFSSPTAGAVIHLPGPIRAWLAIVAAHDRITPEEFLAICICERMSRIGLFPAAALPLRRLPP